MQMSLGFELPVEFHELYQTHDDVGVTGESDEVHWMFRPVAEIPEFIDRIRDWFEGTHPQLAVRFFPSIDWSNGDGPAYLPSKSGELISGLFGFEHEELEFGETQAGDDFLRTAYNSIEEFLKE